MSPFRVSGALRDKKVVGMTVNTSFPNLKIKDDLLLIIFLHGLKKQFLRMQIEAARNMINYFPIFFCLYFMDLTSYSFIPDIFKSFFVDFSSECVIIIT